MTTEEWEACLENDLAADLDPDELQWEDDFLNPDADLTEAELAGIAAAMAARAAAEPGTAGAAETAGAAAGADQAGTGADPAGVARVLAAQAAAASARRRGPGQPGSARPLAGESARAATAFGTGQLLDVMAACPDLAVLAGRAAGDGDSYQGVSDDELIGVLCGWDRLEAHMAARKLAAVAEMVRRRPVLDAPSSGRPAGSGPDDFCADELAHVLAESRHKAAGLIAVADSLDAKLPGTKSALRDGTITFAKVQIITNAVTVLNAKEARAAEKLVLGRAGRLTPGGLRAAISQAVMDVAPEKARARREQAARSARVERWGEDSGNGALAGRELPPAAMLAADHKITSWARQLKAAGLGGDMDQLRARAFLDLLCGTDSRPARQSATAGQDGTGPGGAPGQPGTSPAGLAPAGFAARGHLTIPLATLLGLADRPGQLSGTPSTPGSPATSPTPPPPVRRRPGASPPPTATATPPGTPAPGPSSRTTASPRAAAGAENARNAAAPGPPEPPGTATDRDHQAQPRTRTSPGPGSRSPAPAAPAATARPAAPAPGPSPSTAGSTSSNSARSPPRTATTATRPKATTPAPGSGTSVRSGTPRAPARSAAGPPASATTSTTPPTTQAAGPACATPTPNAAATTGSNSTPSGKSTSFPTGHSGGPRRPGAATTGNQPATRSSWSQGEAPAASPPPTLPGLSVVSCLRDTGQAR